MRLGKRVLISQEELEQIKANKYEAGYKSAKKYYKEFYAEEFEEKIDTLEKSLKKKNKQIKGLESDLEDERATVDVLTKERDNVREVVKQKMELDDLDAVLKQKQELLDARVAKVKTREENVGRQEEGEYKKGYADGVADGVRKINEITQKDRDNAMKVAMVAASSHTPVANLKELNNVHQLTTGNTDPEA